MKRQSTEPSTINHNTMPLITQDCIDKITQSVTIETYRNILRETGKGTGRTISFYSPFEKHRQPKLDVFHKDTKVLWKCWLTGRGGVATKLLMERDGITWIEAVKQIGAINNITLEYEQSAH